MALAFMSDMPNLVFTKQSLDSLETGTNNNIFIHSDMPIIITSNVFLGRKMCVCLVCC